MIKKNELDRLNSKIQQKSTFIESLRESISEVIVGQNDLIDKILISIISNGHILLEGVPGLAKTLTINTVANLINADFKRIQFTPDMLPSDLLGTLIYNQKTGEFNTKKGPIFSNIILADEINRAPSKVQSALLESMQEKQVTIGDDTFKLSKPFLVLATQNPIEQEGTYPLPEAQVDRFMMKVVVDYPSIEEEKEIINRANTQNDNKIKPVVKTKTILEAQSLVNDIYIDSKISEYILNIVFATRNPREFNLSKLVDLISFGASPRASINLVLASKAKAFINGRGYVIPEDVKYVAKDILRHRILLSYEAEAEEITSEDIIDQLLQEVPVPWLKMSKEILKKVRQIEIRTKNIVNDFFGGDYHSNFKGRGMTFSEVREYVPGDDVRSIDWNVTARTGKPHIKIFEEERELSVLILIDVSSSGVFGSKKDLKIDLGIEIAAMLSFSAIKNNDKVGLALFSDKVEKYIPPKKGKKHVLRLITDIVNHDFENSNKRTSIKNAIDYANKISKRKSVIL